MGSWDTEGQKRSQMWWYMPVISAALKRVRHKDHKFEASLAYIVRPYLKKRGKRVTILYIFEF
jgi:hypothetical protein